MTPVGCLTRQDRSQGGVGHPPEAADRRSHRTPTGAPPLTRPGRTQRRVGCSSRMQPPDPPADNVAASAAQRSRLRRGCLRRQAAARHGEQLVAASTHDQPAEAAPLRGHPATASRRRQAGAEGATLRPSWRSSGSENCTNTALIGHPPPIDSNSRVRSVGDEPGSAHGCHGAVLLAEEVLSSPALLARGRGRSGPVRPDPGTLAAGSGERGARTGIGATCLLDGARRHG